MKPAIEHLRTTHAGGQKNVGYLEGIASRENIRTGQHRRVIHAKAACPPCEGVKLDMVPRAGLSLARYSRRYHENGEPPVINVALHKSGPGQGHNVDQTRIARLIETTGGDQRCEDARNELVAAHN